MKNKLFLSAIIIICFSYAIVASYLMIVKNKSPHTIECVGRKVSKDKIYALTFSNRSNQGDTVMLYLSGKNFFGQSDLGYCFFDNSKGQYVFKNSDIVINLKSSEVSGSGLFKLFSHHIDKEIYYSGNEIITQAVLEDGVKFNTLYGSRRDRLSIRLIEHDSAHYISYNDATGGILTKYPIKFVADTIDVLFNINKACANQKFVFRFDDKQLQSQRLQLALQSSAFGCSGKILNAQTGATVADFEGSNAFFALNGYLFRITQKYSLLFSICLLIVLLGVLFFSLLLARKSENIVSPAIRTIYTSRIYLNCIFYLSIPLFLTSFVFVDGRVWFLFFIVLVNLSFFIPKSILHFTQTKNSSRLPYFLYSFIFIFSAFIVAFTRSESLFGIPVLHISKVLIVILIYALHIQFPNNHNRTKIAIILLYGSAMGFMTHDFGSVIFTALALLLIQALTGKITIKQIILLVVMIIVFAFAFYQLFPTLLESRKIYRLFAPYINPALASLANQSDRETYSSLIYAYKSMFESLPLFNEIRIPGEFRSVFHSDYAFFTSILLGRFFFLIPFILVVGLLLKDMFVLLILSLKTIRVSEDKFFTMAQTPESKAISFLLAITIVQFIYPIFSNLLILPLTGQSIPVLSISNGEVIIITILLVCLHSIFSNNTKYLTSTNQVSGNSVLNLKQIDRIGNVILITSLILLCVLIGLKTYQISNIPNAMEWEKTVKSDNEAINKISDLDRYNKFSLLSAANNIVSNDMLSLSAEKRQILRELACTFYTGKTFSEMLSETQFYRTGLESVNAAFIIDSVFSRKQKLISGSLRHPFGYVYRFNQEINNKSITNVSNPLYATIPRYSTTVNADLTALANQKLMAHIEKMNARNNIGAFMVIDLQNGNIIVNSCYPFDSDCKSLEKPYLIGSVKKLLVAYSALEANPGFKDSIYNGITFDSFLQSSSNAYASKLLQQLLLHDRKKLENQLEEDFNLPLFSLTENAYFDRRILDSEICKPLNNKSAIYRSAIGQQQPYSFLEVMKWYLRFASGRKQNLQYTESNECAAPLSLNQNDIVYLQNCFNKVLNRGTADKVRLALEKANINTLCYGAKTGTSENSKTTTNNSSTFIIWNSRYLVGTFINGNVPENSSNLSAKDLFISTIQLLRDNGILY